MANPIDIDLLVVRFRLASRWLFNHYFRFDDPYNSEGSDARDRFDEVWDVRGRFKKVEAALFDALVIEPAGLDRIRYGEVNHHIRVARRSESAPVMLNRELRSGYWDHPISEVTSEVELAFVDFFDWDQVGVSENQYVQSEVIEWPGHPELAGKRALIESREVRFRTA